MNTSLESFIQSCDDMMIAKESASSDISTFLEDPSLFLNVHYRNAQFRGFNGLYTEVLKTDGSLYASIMKACNELEKVHAFQEALLLLLTNMIDIMESIIPEVKKDDKENLQWSIDEFKSRILSLMNNRDEYTSNRKAIIAKYKSIVEASSK